MVMSPEKCSAEHWDKMCLTVFTVSSGGRPCLPGTNVLLTLSAQLTLFMHNVVTKWEIHTNSVLRWCWSAPWPLISARWLLWGAATSCWLCRPASQSRWSPRGRDWAHLETDKRDSKTLDSCSFCRWADIHSPNSLLTLFFCRWPMKCHLISGHDSKICEVGKRNHEIFHEFTRVGKWMLPYKTCKLTRGSEALSTSSLTWWERKDTISLMTLRAVYSCRPAASHTHIVLSKVTLPLSVGLHDHLWRFRLADSYEAGRHSWQCLRKDKTGSFFISISECISRRAQCVSAGESAPSGSCKTTTTLTASGWGRVQMLLHIIHSSLLMRSTAHATKGNLNETGKMPWTPPCFDLDINLDASFHDGDIFTCWQSCSVRRGWSET